jgi:hypothetical protein
MSTAHPTPVQQPNLLLKKNVDVIIQNVDFIFSQTSNMSSPSQDLK